MAGLAFQIQVQGLLDGTTPFVPPAPLPAPDASGVRRIDAGVAIDVGSFDLCSLIGTPGVPLWLRACHVEFNVGTLAARLRYILPGLVNGTPPTPELLLPIQATGNPVEMPLLRLGEKLIVPPGCDLQVLTDDTSSAFGGAPVAGPHFVYFEIDPLTDDERLSIVQDLQSFANAKNGAQGQKLASFQAVAASGTDVVPGIIQTPNTNIGARMQATATVSLGAVPAVAETMQFDITRISPNSGALVIVGTITVDNTNAANVKIPVPMDPALNLWGDGARLQVTRTYVPGGGPTPIVNTQVQVEFVPQLAQ